MKKKKEKESRRKYEEKHQTNGGKKILGCSWILECDIDSDSFIVCFCYLQIISFINIKALCKDNFFVVFSFLFF